jgi:hypothetical protein
VARQARSARLAARQMISARRRESNARCIAGWRLMENALRSGCYEECRLRTQGLTGRL